jgi:hypothetical protein
MYLADEMGQTIVKVRVWWKTLTERESLEDLRVNGRRILKRIIHKWNKWLCTGMYLAHDTDNNKVSWVPSSGGTFLTSPKSY